MKLFLSFFIDPIGPRPLLLILAGAAALLLAIDMLQTRFAMNTPPYREAWNAVLIRWPRLLYPWFGFWIVATIVVALIGRPPAAWAFIVGEILTELAAIINNVRIGIPFVGRR